MSKLIFPMSPKEAQEKGINNPSALNREAIFPERLRQLRAERGISQREFAEQIGVTKSTISLYEQGDNVPDIKTFAKIADFYDVSYDYLLGKSENKSRKNVEIGKELGLSDYVISLLRQLNNSENPGASSILKYTNTLFEHNLQYLIRDIGNLDKEYKEQCLKEKEYYSHLNKETAEEEKFARIIVGNVIYRGRSDSPGFISMDMTKDSYADFEIQRITKEFYSIIEQIIGKKDQINTEGAKMNGHS